MRLFCLIFFFLLTLTVLFFSLSCLSHAHSFNGSVSLSLCSYPLSLALSHRPTRTIVFPRRLEPLHSGGLFGRNELYAVFFVAAVEAVVLPVANLLGADARKLRAEKKIARAPPAVQLVRSVCVRVCVRVGGEEEGRTEGKKRQVYVFG